MSITTAARPTESRLEPASRPIHSPATQCSKCQKPLADNPTVDQHVTLIGSVRVQGGNHVYAIKLGVCAPCWAALRKADPTPQQLVDRRPMAPLNLPPIPNPRGGRPRKIVPETPAAAVASPPRAGIPPRHYARPARVYAAK